MNRDQWLMLLLLLALVCNILMQVTHPAYRFYRRAVRELDAKYDAKHDEFVRRVEREFVPAITNLANSTRTTRSAVGLSAVVDRNSPSYVPRVEPLDGARFFMANGCEYIQYCGHSFAVGDDLFGDAIARITPTSVLMSCGDLYLLKSSRQNQPQPQQRPVTEVNRAVK